MAVSRRNNWYLRFFADAMLGKLARWLRIIGYNTQYLPTLNDTEILNLARTEGLTIITRDNQLFLKLKKENLPCLLLKTLTIEGELAELSEYLHQVPSGDSRCPLCNTPLQVMDQLSLSSPSISHFSPLWQCNRCGKIYWHGSHWRRIAGTLKVLEKR